MAPPNKSRPFSTREGITCFVALWALWALARWPAFVHPFWAADDFSIWDFTTWGMLSGGASMGRLLNAYYYSLLYLFPPPDHLGGSIVLRSLAGALHSGASLILLIWISPIVGRIGAGCAVLLFHLWAFNGETTIWFAGSTYPLAVLCSMGGVALFMGERSSRRVSLGIIGGFLIVVALHSNQAPAMAGVCFWLLVSAFRLLAEGGVPIPRLVKEVLWIGGSYGVGGGLSLWSMKVFEGSRFAGTVVLSEKVVQLGDIWERLWWFPGIYPLALQIAYSMFLGLALGTWAWATFRRWINVWQSLAVIGLFAALAVAPFAANLLAPDNSFPVRVLYAGTLIWVAMAAWIAWFSRRSPLVGWVGGGLFASIVLWNVILGVRESAEFSEIYRRDLATLRELEAFAAEHGTTEVLFMDWQHSAPWKSNPYDLKLHYDHTVKVPVFQKIYWTYRFLKYYSEDLENTPWWPVVPGEGTRWDRLREEHADFARALPRDEWIRFVYLEEEDLVLVVPR